MTRAVRTKRHIKTTAVRTTRYQLREQAFSAQYPKASANLTFFVVTNSAEVNIKWNATADADYYTVYRKNVGVWQKLADSVTGTSYCDSTITSGKIYYYKVVANKKSPDFRATKSNGESIVTNTGAQQSGDSNTVLINTNAEISKKHLMCAEVTPIPEQTYTGSAVCPQINAYYDGVPLAKGRLRTEKAMRLKDGISPSERFMRT